jgi:hypothetical protein
MHGLVFNSHAGWKSTPRCTWSAEYGDGFFRVSHDILGQKLILSGPINGVLCGVCLCVCVTSECVRGSELIRPRGDDGVVI